MNVLIIGQNAVNGEISGFFETRGYSPFVIEEAGAVKSFSGEAGNFKIRAGADDRKAAFVVITEPTGKPMPDIDGGIPCSIFEPGDMKKISESGAKDPVVILLDYFNESPPASTARALEQALLFAARKIDVVFIFRFMRTAGMETEELYRKARNAGVTFIKYESLKISHDREAGRYDIEVSDGINDVRLSARFIAADSGYGVSEKFAKLAKKLRLKADGAGYINGSRYFLNPSLTGRKGVYYLNPDVCADRLCESLDYTIAAACADLSGGCPDKNHAEVDGEKCVFCYTCFRACPHGAMEPDGENRVMKNRNFACEGCGTCASVCPGNAVTMSEDDFVAAAAQGKSGKVKVFCCENSGELALREILPGLGELASKIDYEAVPCGGRIGFEQISGALRFYGKVITLVCMDDACRHFDGNSRACRQTERLAAMLSKAGVDEGRVFCIKTSHAMANFARDNILEVLK